MNTKKILEKKLVLELLKQKLGFQKKFRKIIKKISKPQQKNDAAKTTKVKRKLKIAQKLYLVCGIAIGMNMLMIIFVSATLQNAEQKMNSFYHVEYKNSIQQMQIRNDVASLENAILSAVYLDDYQKSNEVVDLAVQKTVTDINLLKKQFFDEQLMKQLNSDINEFLAQEMKVMSYAFAGNSEKAMNLIEGEYAQCVERLYTVLDTVSVKAEDAAKITLQETIQQRKNMTMMLNLAMILFGLTLLFISVMLARTIRKSTYKVLHIADCIKKGNLNISDVQHTSGDELDEVICSCEQMTITLQTLIQDVGCMLNEMAKGNMVYETLYRQYYVGDYNSLLVAAENMKSYINYALNNVDAATQKVEDHVKQVSEGAQYLSAHALKQDESIIQLSNTLGVISENAKHNTQQIEKINLETMQMNEQVGITRQQMSETTSAILDVNTHTDRIKKIIHTIDDIAFQTDLLALNASIEAARAGSAGRGFAVVAGEVRSLAQKVTQAAKETANLIENSLKATNNSVITVSQTADSLDLVVNGINHIANMITDISKVVKEEQVDIHNISNEAENIRQIVRINTETAQKFVIGSEDGYQQVSILKQQMEQFIRQEGLANEKTNCLDL